MIWFGKILYVTVWFSILWQGSATILKNVDYILRQNAGVMIQQMAGATIWQNAGNIMISQFVVQYDIVGIDLVW